MKKIFDLGLEKIEYILHISDLHIRNLKRRTEYLQVFEKVKKEFDIIHHEIIK